MKLEELALSQEDLKTLLSELKQMGSEESATTERLVEEITFRFKESIN
ncbi:hypothetical protein [Alteribacter aurantiacus]|nr:hypothetical protein [Alteribacter aurantiacus]